MSFPTQASDTISVPQKTGIHKPQQFEVTTTPAEYAAWTGLSPVPTGVVYITLKAIGGNVRFWFKASTADSVGVTSTTGYRLADGATEPFLVSCTALTAFEAVSDATCVLEMTITSPEYNMPGKVV